MITKYNKGFSKEKPPDFDGNGLATVRDTVVKDC